MFEIKVPQKEKDSTKINHLAAHKITSFVISRGASLSTDAIALALKHNIDIVIVENNGHPLGRFWHSRLGSTAKIRKEQLRASMNESGVSWTKTWLTNKLDNQSDFLKELKKHRQSLQSFLDEKAEAILSFREKIDSARAEKMSDIADSFRGWEGSAGRHYFEALSKCMPADFAFQGRSFRPAKDEFNAMLNYAYGILYSRTERALMLAGLDPYVGFMHRDDYNTKSLVFDYIEPYRIYAERFVFRLFTGKKINKSYFQEIANGFSLNKEGKEFFVGSYLEFLDAEKIKYKGKLQTRMNAAQLEAHRFANSLIERSNTTDNED